jgi:hypothetical protein
MAGSSAVSRARERLSVREVADARDADAALGNLGTEGASRRDAGRAGGFDAGGNPLPPAVRDLIKPVHHKGNSLTAWRS